MFDDSDSRKLAEVKTEDGKKEKYLLYYDGETVSGKVNVNVIVGTESFVICWWDI